MDPIWPSNVAFFAHLGGGNSNIFNFHPEPWGNDPIWRAYFSDGLKPPPRHGKLHATHPRIRESIRAEGLKQPEGFGLDGDESDDFTYGNTVSPGDLLWVDRFVGFDLTNHLGPTKSCTPPEVKNIEKWWLEDDVFPIGMAYFQGRLLLNFQGGYCNFSSRVFPSRSQGFHGIFVSWEPGSNVKLCWWSRKWLGWWDWRRIVALAGFSSSLCDPVDLLKFPPNWAHWLVKTWFLCWD